MAKEFITIHYPHDYDCFIVEHDTLEEALKDQKNSSENSNVIVTRRIELPQSQEKKS